MSKSLNKSVSFISPTGLIELQASGPSTPEAVKRNIVVLKNLVMEVQGEHKPVLILINIEKITSTSRSSRNATASALVEVPHDKAAFYGPLRLRMIMKTLARLTGENKTVRVFSNRDTAISWLRGATEDQIQANLA